MNRRMSRREKKELDKVLHVLEAVVKPFNHPFEVHIHRCPLPEPVHSFHLPSHSVVHEQHLAVHHQQHYRTNHTREKQHV